jgi:hypothetical protein
MPLRSLNGWQRLGVFISTLIALPSFLIGYTGNQSANVYYFVPESTRSFESLNPQMWVNKVYWDAQSKNDELKGCVNSTVKVRATTSYTAEITCTKTLSRTVWDSKWWAIIPFLVVFGVGYMISWIVVGFRQGRNKETS